MHCVQKYTGSCFFLALNFLHDKYCDTQCQGSVGEYPQMRAPVAVINAIGVWGGVNLLCGNRPAIAFLAVTRKSLWHPPVTVTTSNVNTFLWVWVCGTAQVTTTPGNPTNKWSWLQAPVNSQLLATQAFVRVKWWGRQGGSRSRGQHQGPVCRPKPTWSGYLLFSAA